MFLYCRYFPTRLWGFSGHVQTIIQGIISRFHYPLISGKRYFFVQSDGTTVTYDLYQPIEHHALNGENLLPLCSWLFVSKFQPTFPLLAVFDTVASIIHDLMN